MNFSSKTGFLLILVFVALGSGCIYSTGGEKVLKVADFPDKPEFQREVAKQSGAPMEKVYVDAGYVWKQTTFFWCPIFNEEGRYVGHIGSDSQFLPLQPYEIKEMANKAQVVLPDSPPLPFWDAIGGKLVGVVIAVILILIYVIRHFSD